jgi:hypothetical protein
VGARRHRPARRWTWRSASQPSSATISRPSATPLARILALFTTFPFYQRMFQASGLAEEAARAEQGAGGDSLSDRMLDAICLIGPILRCREQLAAFRVAGVDLPILSLPIGVEGAREVIRAMRL